MSDSLLRYVPADPSHVPGADQVARAAQLLSRWLPMAENICSHIETQVVFVDAGGNWDGVRCPACEADAEDWWGNAMDVAAESGFENLHAQAACCGADVSLNDLKYGWPVAFGRFFLEAVNPNAAGLSEQALHELGEALGGPLRQIRVHV